MTPPKTIRTNQFSITIGCRINIQKSVTLLYTDNKISEKENNPIYKKYFKNCKFNQGSERLHTLQ